MGRAPLEMSGTRVFLYGPLADARILDAVLGRPAADGVPATLGDHELRAAGAVVAPVPAFGRSVEGVVLDLGPEASSRLAYHQAAAGYEAVRLDVDGAPTLVFTAPLSEAGPYEPAAWSAVWAPIVAATAGDVMALWPVVPVERVRPRYRLMLVQGASRVRAAEPAPARRRHAASASDVSVVSRRQPYANFFAVEEYDLSFRSFKGGMSPTVNRAVFVSGDAVTVLPYDPRRDRVLLIEQFRPGPFGRGDGQPWLLEPIAGRIDPGETPEMSARREAVEEAGLALGALLPVASYYPTPAAKAEYLYSYVALADLPDGIEGVFGMEGEAEDIRGHLVDFDEMMDLVRTGEICNGPLLLTALWLERERARLQAENR
ncbi:tellurite resistance ADP-ribose pyrophosphatase TrgB [Rhodobacter sp. NSM]|uniref:tellurite resistance ADP-ribose pyrophosphatase TrgB n=1 Tax=Rhodobacter sp. NSM TaxID=3457501 RepID=UPI003FD41B4D